MVDFSSDVNPLEELLQRQESERQFEERIRQEVARQNEGAQQAGTTSTPTGFRTPEQEGAAQELAQQLGVHSTELSQWIANRRRPRNEQIRDLARILGCKIKEIYPDYKLQ